MKKIKGAWKKQFAEEFGVSPDSHIAVKIHPCRIGAFIEELLRSSKMKHRKAKREAYEKGRVEGFKQATIEQQ